MSRLSSFKSLISWIYYVFTNDLFWWGLIYIDRKYFKYSKRSRISKQQSWVFILASLLLKIGYGCQKKGMSVKVANQKNIWRFVKCWYKATIKLEFEVSFKTQPNDSLNYNQWFFLPFCFKVLVAGRYTISKLHWVGHSRYVINFL